MLKKLLKKDWYIILIIFVFLYVQAMTVLQLPTYMSDIISNGIAVSDLQYIYLTGVKMLVVALLGAICSITVSLLASRLGSGIARDLRKDIFDHVTYMDQEEFSQFETSSLITRSTNDINQISQFAIIFFRLVFYAPILGIGGILKAMQTSNGMSSLTIVIAAAVCFLIVSILIILNLSIPKFKITQKLIDKINTYTREDLNGMLVIRSLNRQKNVEEKFDKINDQYYKINVFVNRIMSLLDPIMNFVMNGVSVAIIWVAAYQIENITQVGNIVAFMQYAIQIIMSFMIITMVFIFIPRAMVSVNRINEVLKTKNRVKDSGKDDFKDIKGNIEFKNVSFKYSKAEDYVLKDINFKIKDGQTIAFIGSTGCGKSTLINLLPRLFDVTDGEILIDGVNIKDIPLHQLRELISYVPQKGTLFSGTIKSNVKDGDKNANDDEVKAALDIAQATEFIASTEKGIDNKVAQAGSNYSGGQKQRLSIARALVKKAKIIIFDDSFSALDFKTDAKLRISLKNRKQKQTVLIVAQRIGTIMNADQIIVLNEGKVVGIGKHDDLLKSCSIYKEIAESQLGTGANI